MIDLAELQKEQKVDEVSVSLPLTVEVETVSPAVDVTMSSPGSLLLSGS